MSRILMVIPITLVQISICISLFKKSYNNLIIVHIFKIKEYKHII